METRSDNLKKIPVASKLRKPSKKTSFERKFTGSALERQAASVSNQKEIPQLTPLHRLQRFKAIRDKNLRNKGSKTSLENRLRKMEEVVTATTTVEIKEKIATKETFKEVEVNDTNGIKQFENDVKEVEKKNIENGHDGKRETSPIEDHDSSLRLKETKNDKTVENTNVIKEIKTETKTTETEKEIKPIQDSNIESHSETEELNIVGSESLSENDANSSSSRIAVTTSTPGPTDDEEEIDLFTSMHQCELSANKKKSDLTNQEKKEAPAENSFSFKEIAGTSGLKNWANRGCSSTSVFSCYKSSYNNLTRIYGRRPVRHLAASRKRKLTEELTKNYEKSPSQPSPNWRFSPSMNFWTPKTTPFIFSAPTPLHNLNDSMTVNVDEDTIRNHMDDSDLFSDINEFPSQPTKKPKLQWGCAIM